MRFGRDTRPKLEHVTGLTTRANGDYVLADPSQKRVFVFDKDGQAVTDFAYTFKYFSFRIALQIKNIKLRNHIRSLYFENIRIHTPLWR